MEPQKVHTNPWEERVTHSVSDKEKMGERDYNERMAGKRKGVKKKRPTKAMLETHTYMIAHIHTEYKV